MLPAHRSAQKSHTELPLPSVSLPQRAVSIGPLDMNSAGISAEIAPMRSAGVVLSQPPISTAASMGWQRSTSSVSIANRLR